MDKKQGALLRAPFFLFVSNAKVRRNYILNKHTPFFHFGTFFITDYAQQMLGLESIQE
jgi:hypothetical protein